MPIRGTFLALALAAILAPGAVHAQDAQKDTKAGSETGCGAFAWPVARERDWFGDKKLAHRASGARLAKIDRAVALTLAPTRRFKFFLSPERAPKPDSFSGVVTFFGVPRPGVYQVTLSGDAWVDVFENGTRLKSTAFTGAKGCSGVRKSVRFKLAPGDLVNVQVSNAADNTIKIAFAEAR